MAASWYRRIIHRLRLWLYIIFGTGDHDMDKWISDMAMIVYLSYGKTSDVNPNHTHGVLQRLRIAGMRLSFLDDRPIELDVPPVVALIDFAKQHPSLCQYVPQISFQSKGSMIYRQFYGAFILPVLSGIPSALDERYIPLFMWSYVAEIHNSRLHDDEVMNRYDMHDAQRIIHKYDLHDAQRIIHKYGITIPYSSIGRYFDMAMHEQSHNEMMIDSIFYDDIIVDEEDEAEEHHESMMAASAYRIAIFMLNYGDEDFSSDDIETFLNTMNTAFASMPVAAFPMRHLLDMRAVNTYYENSYDIFDLVCGLLYTRQYKHTDDSYYAGELSTYDYAWLHGIDFMKRPDDDASYKVFKEALTKEIGMQEIMFRALKNHDEEAMISILYVEKLWNDMIDHDVFPIVVLMRQEVSSLP